MWRLAVFYARASKSTLSSRSWLSEIAMAMVVIEKLLLSNVLKTNSVHLQSQMPVTSWKNRFLGKIGWTSSRRRRINTVGGMTSSLIQIIVLNSALLCFFADTICHHFRSSQCRFILRLWVFEKFKHFLLLQFCCFHVHVWKILPPKL